MKRFALLSTLAVALLCTTAASAQNYDDDDLYYSPAKARVQEQERARARAAQAQAAGLAASDTYSQGSSMPLQIDTDTYNRRGAAPASQEEAARKADFSYTRRIERFHNPNVVEQSGDTALMQEYYSTPDEQAVNVYVINNIDPVYGWTPGPYRYGYSGGYFAYDPWSYGWTWPSLGWSISFGPWYGGWSYGWYDPFYNPWYPWGPGFAWGGPCWGHHHHWWGPSYAWGYDRPGASRPHRPVYSGSSRPAGGNSYRPSQVNPGHSGAGRPGNFGRPSVSRPASGVSDRVPSNGYVRPGYVPGTGPGNSGGTYGRPVTSGQGNRGGSYSSGGSSNYRVPSSSSGSYNRGSSSSSSYRSPSSGSYNRGSSGSHRSPGSSSRGGGGSRGGRR